MWAGNIMNGGVTIIIREVCWGTSLNSATINSTTYDDLGTGVYTSSLTPLAYSTLYYVQTYATSNIGTAYSNGFIT
jgi:hypothetical protein